MIDEYPYHDIEGYEGLYQISSSGYIKRLARLGNHGKKDFKREVSEQFLKPWLNRGYYTVSLTKEGDRKEIALHILIALTFMPNPDNKPCINHINGIKTDNKLSNLEWCTYAENNIHAYSTGLKYCTTKKSISQYTKGGKLVKNHDSILESSKDTGIKRSNITRHLSGGRPSAGGFIFKYN